MTTRLHAIPSQRTTSWLSTLALLAAAPAALAGTPINEHAAADAAHRLGLHVGRDECGGVEHDEKPGEAKHAVEVTGADIRVDRVL